MVQGPWRLVWFLFVLSCLHAPTSQPATPTNLNFEQGQPGLVPESWFVPPAVEQQGWAAKLTTESPKQGKQCALIYWRERGGGGFGNLMQTFAADRYRGKRVRFRAAVRVETEGAFGRAQMWLRVDREGERMGFFDNMGDRPITSQEWGYYEIVGDIDGDAEWINIGCMLIGQGKVYIDDASFEVVGETPVEKPSLARPLTGRGLENLVAFTRLLGYVRHFHPSDQAAKTDWNRFAIEGMKVVEGANSAEELAQKLQAWFRPIAPTMSVFPTGKKPSLPKELAPPKSGKGLKVVMWRHLGFGTGDQQSIYRSNRESKAIPNGKVPVGFHDPSKPYIADLGVGISCSVPLALYADSKGTLPHVTANAGAKSSPALYSAKDRATRLAAVALGWNVWQHFCPYFDVVKTDWNRALRDALQKAATDEDEVAFLNTLRRLVAQLQDGHGYVSHMSDPATHTLPVLADWIEEQAVITYVAPEGGRGLKPGDVILKVAGRPIQEVLLEKEQLVSGATPKRRRSGALEELLAGPEDSEVTLEVQSGSETPRTVTLRRTLGRGTLAHFLSEPRPPKIKELEPGIFYLDLTRINDKEFQEALPKLERAQRIIFDMRGYPSDISPATIGHLIGKPVTCAQWHVPIIIYPDRRQMKFHFSNWSVQPKSPRLKVKIAFLTDGRAISYAETYLGIIEHYKLAAIIGEPTAGTNGNVNPISLPGGYMVAWTGMKVLKHDGSQHHGIGIQPTVRASRTIQGIREGRDEMLEKALEVVKNSGSSRSGGEPKGDEHQQGGEGKQQAGMVGD